MRSINHQIFLLLFFSSALCAFAGIDNKADSFDMTKNYSSEFVPDKPYSTAVLQEDIENLRRQLVKTDKASAPVEWAKTQHDLGVILRIFRAQSVAGNLHDMAAPDVTSPDTPSQICKRCQLLLTESLAAFRAALEVRTRSRAPADWAETQYEMGATLLALGELESDIEQLKAASAAFRESLRVYNRQKNPEAWGKNQLFLAETLQRLGILSPRTAGKEHLKKSIAAYQEALKVYTPESENWAAIQNNMGNALNFFGEFENSKKHFQGAVAAFRTALAAVNPQVQPWFWATIQNNMGNVLRKLGINEENKGYLKEALDAYRAALTIRTPEKDASIWAGTQTNLAQTLHSLGARESGSAALEYLKDAISTYRTLLAFTEREKMIVPYAAYLIDMSNTLYVLGRKEKDITKLEEALDANLKGVNILSEELPPMLWVKFLVDFGDMLYYSAEFQEAGTKWLDEAETVYQNVWNIYNQPGSGVTQQDVFNLEFMHNKVRKLLKTRQTAP